MMWFDEDEKEYHSGLYFRKYKGDNIASPGLELLFDTVQEAAEYVKGNMKPRAESLTAESEKLPSSRQALNPKGRA